jgi:hypothetical protein
MELRESEKETDALLGEQQAVISLLGQCSDQKRRYALDLFKIIYESQR